MTQRKTRKRSQIPEFHSIQEAAEFWDTHSPPDFPDEFGEVEVHFGSKRLKRVVDIELDDEHMDQLMALAREQGISPVELARGWILEHLGEPSPER